jgi:hypothetical protein
MLAYSCILLNATQVSTETALATTWDKVLIKLSRFGIISSPVLVTIPIFINPIHPQSGCIANGADPTGSKACLNGVLSGIEVEEHAAIEDVPLVHVGTHRGYIPVPFLAR